MRISDWSSDVCSSDLPCRASVDRLRNPRGCAHPRNGLRCDHSCYRRRPNGARQANQEIRKRDRGLSHRTDHVSAVPRVRRRPDRSPKYDPYTTDLRSEENTSELQSLMRISYAVFRLKKKKKYTCDTTHIPHLLHI